MKNQISLHMMHSITTKNSFQVKYQPKNNTIRLWQNFRLEPA